MLVMNRWERERLQERRQELITMAGRRNLGRHNSVRFMCCLSLKTLDTYTALSSPPILGNELNVGLCIEGLPPLLAGAAGLRHWTPGLQGDDVLAT